MLRLVQMDSKLSRTSAIRCWILSFGTGTGTLFISAKLNDFWLAPFTLLFIHCFVIVDINTWYKYFGFMLGWINATFCPRQHLSLGINAKFPYDPTRETTISFNWGVYFCVNKFQTLSSTFNVLSSSTYPPFISCTRTILYPLLEYEGVWCSES